MTKYCSSLNDARSPSQCGAKAANLAFLLNHGLGIPRGFVLSDRAFARFLDENRLRAPIESLLEGLDFSDPRQLRETSLAIRSLVMSGNVPMAIQREMEPFLGELKAQRLIVRSSAAGEDSHVASFAGQLDSYPTPNSGAEILSALKACWASFWSERSLFYQNARGVKLAAMGVVVQEMVEARLSGVTFSHFPAASHEGGRSGEMLLEYVAGEGQLLVSGEVNPGRIAVARNGESLNVRARPEQQSCRPESVAAMESHLAFKLRDAALVVERAMGGPQDIEWCIDEQGAVRVVQARPITTEGSEAATILWSNVNVNENYPDPVTPLLYSVARRAYFHYFLSLGNAFGVSGARLRRMRQELSHVIGLHGGRIYYNLTNIYRLISLLPFGDSAAAYFDSFIGVSAMKAPDARHVSRFRETAFWLQWVELLRIAVTTLFTICNIPRRVRALEHDVDDHVETCGSHRDPSHPVPDLARLRWEFAGFLHIRFRKWRKGALADAASMFSYGLLCSFLKKRLHTPPSRFHSLLKAIPNVVSCIPPQKLWEMSDEVRACPPLLDFVKNHSAAETEASLDGSALLAPLRRRVLDFQNEWGFRCSGELMLSLPNYRDNRLAVLELVKAYVAKEQPSPESIMREQAREREELEQRVATTLAGRFPTFLSPSVGIFKALLRATHASIALRERVRMKQARLYAQFRQTLLDVGETWRRAGFLKERDDVFFLFYPEIERGLQEKALHDAARIVERRKRERALATRSVPPDTFRARVGESFVAAEPSPETTLPTSGGGMRMQGLGACGGKIQATARVLESVLEAGALLGGDVLVTRQTDPGWAPVFPLIKGLVMERGGMLSHGAIVAREFGIPAVVGIRGASHVIRSGETVAVDGDQGFVEIRR